MDYVKLKSFVTVLERTHECSIIVLKQQGSPSFVCAHGMHGHLTPVFSWKLRDGTPTAGMPCRRKHAARAKRAAEAERARMPGCYARAAAPVARG
jgi:hypothetical protein